MQILKNNCRIILLFCLMNVNCLYSQELNCYSKQCKINLADLKSVCSNYVTNYTTPDKYKYILFIDYLNVNGINTYTSVENDCVRNLFWKKPDCFFFDFNHLIYIYTKDYSQKKDSSWLESLVNITCNYFNFPKSYSHWKTDSISYIGTGNLFNYDPETIEYKTKKGKIISKSRAVKMIFSK